MANRQLEKIWGLGKDYVVVAGSFAPNGSSAIAATSNKGKGYSVAYTSTGLYTITFTDAYSDLISFMPMLQLATGADTFLQVGTYTAAAKTITIRNWDVSDAAVADIAANANNRINFVAVFRNSSVTSGGSA